MGEPRARRRKLKPPVGPAKRLIQLDRGVVRLRLRPDRQRGATLLYGVAALVGLATLVTMLWVDKQAWWGLLAAPIFIGLGYLFGQPDRVTRLDFRDRSVAWGDRETGARTIPFAQLAALVADAHIETVHTRDASYEVRRFVLGFVVADAAAPIHAALATLRLERGASVCEGRQSSVQKLSPGLERQLQTGVLRVIDHSDEVAVWQASEWLAKQLDLPIVDACSVPTMLRIPEELDLPLGQRLAAGVQAIDEFDDATAAYARVSAPPGASVERQDGTCTLTWRNNRLSIVLFFAGFSLFFPVMGLLLLEGPGAALWVFVGLGFCQLLLAWLGLHWHGVNRIAVDRKRVRVTRGPFGKRLPPLRTDRIEAVRVGGTSVSPLLTLISEQGVLRIPMTVPLARWAKRHIERHLRAVYDKPAGSQAARAHGTRAEGSVER